MTNLESKTEPAKYDLLDYMIPFLALRHLPRALTEEDKVCKYTETAYNVIVVGTNLFLYSMILI